MYLYVDESVPPVGLIHIKNLLDQFYAKYLIKLFKENNCPPNLIIPGRSLTKKTKGQTYLIY